MTQIPSTLLDAPPPPKGPGARASGSPPDAPFASVLDDHQARTATAEGQPRSRRSDRREPVDPDAHAPADPAEAQGAQPDAAPAGVALVALLDLPTAAPVASGVPAPSAPAALGTTMPSPSAGGTPALAAPGGASGPGPSAAATPVAAASPAAPALGADPLAASGGAGASSAGAALRQDGGRSTFAAASSPGAATAPADAGGTTGRAGSGAPPAAASAGAAAAGGAPTSPSAFAPAAPREAERAGATPPATTTAPAAAAPTAPLGAAPSADGALPTRGVGLAEAVETVKLALRAAADRGIAHARIALSPRELGGIEIHLRQTADGLVARVTAEHAAAAQLLHHAGAELRRSLEGQGLTLLRLDVDTAGADAGTANGRHDLASGGAGGQGPGGRPAGGRRAATTIEGELTVPVAADPTDPATGTLALPNGALVDVLA